MIPIKIQCGCGQRYAFDLEPVNRRMPSPVACPVCGADGTEAANTLIAQALPETAAGPPIVLRLNKPPTTAIPAVRPASSVPSPLSSIRPLAPPNRKLAWYEMLWIALPIGLVAVGGAIGGGCGGLAWAVNKRVFQKTANPALRYVGTGLISAMAVLVWLLAAALVFSLLKKH